MAPDWQTDSLPELRGLIWAELARAADDGQHPWRTPAFATSDTTGPHARTVVLREVLIPARQLVAQSDARAPKLRQLAADPRAAWLFHDGGQRVQLRAATEVAVHQADEVARAAWAKVPEANRRNYLTTEPPGAVIARPGPRQITADGPPHFAVLVATVVELDWLWLAEGGHRRARFRWDGAAWDEVWRVP